MKNEIMISTLNTVLRLRSKYYRNVKHLKNVRSLGEGKNFINEKQDSKLKEVEKHQQAREVFFNNLSKAIIKVGDDNEEV